MAEPPVVVADPPPAADRREVDLHVPNATLVGLVLAPIVVLVLLLIVA